MSAGLETLDTTVARALARCRDALDDAIDTAAGDEDRAVLIGLALASAVAGHAHGRVTGAPGRVPLATLEGADPEEVIWALEAIANIDLEALAEATGATLVLQRRLS